MKIKLLRKPRFAANRPTKWLTLTGLAAIFAPAAVLVLSFWSVNSPAGSFPNRLGYELIKKIPPLQYPFVFHPQIRSWLNFTTAGDDRLDFTSQTFFDRIEIVVFDFETEEDWQNSLNRDVRLEKATAENLKQTLAECCPKKNGINVLHQTLDWPVPEAGFTQETAKDVVLSRQHPARDRIKSLNFFFLPGQWQNMASGTAPTGSSLIFFLDSLPHAADAETEPEIQQAKVDHVVIHEFGHLLGLSDTNLFEEVNPCVMDLSADFLSEEPYGIYEGLRRENKSSARQYLKRILPTSFCLRERVEIRRLSTFSGFRNPIVYEEHR